MSEPPELWVYLISNLIVLLFGGAITALSLFAYRDSGNPSFRGAAAGFGLITAGALAEGVYQLLVRGSYELSGRELLAVQTVEGVLIAAGLVALFHSLRAY